MAVKASYQDRLRVSYRKACRPDPVCNSDGSYKIFLSQDLFTIIDACDLNDVEQFTWRPTNLAHSAGAYAHRTYKFYIDGKRRSGTELLHRRLLSAPDELWVDHANGNTLDNRRANLRLCTKAENARNRKMNVACSNRYKGVRHERNQWRAAINVHHRHVFLGYFNTQLEAALAYDAAAIRYHGEFAALNFASDLVPARAIDPNASEFIERSGS